jgi:N-acetyl-gamma-glutamyl-phosphate reductase
MTLKAAILGASGYTGADMLRLALGHGDIEIIALSGERKAGQSVAEVLPNFAFHTGLPALVNADAIDYDALDVVFGCLPHATSQALIKTIMAGKSPPRIVDLSADFRLRDAATYQAWYGGAHVALDLQATAVYGLTEFARAALPTANIVACPGCYPTAALLALLPLLSAKLIKTTNITINALSGVSGAGRSLKESNLFCEVAEAMQPYALGGHRHMPEIEQELSHVAGEDVTISFVPHLIPINRGELETIMVEMAPGTTIADLRAALAARYQDEPFVHVLAEGVAPATRMIRGSNHCVLNVFADRIKGRAVIVSCIDNLIKGSSGQALQNFNAMFGFDERRGLTALPLFP